MIFYLFFKSNIEIRKFYFIFKMVFSTHYRVMSENPCQYLNCDDVFLFFLKILLNFIVLLHLTHKKMKWAETISSWERWRRRKRRKRRLYREETFELSRPYKEQKKIIFFFFFFFCLLNNFYFSSLVWKTNSLYTMSRT